MDYKSTQTWKEINEIPAVFANVYDYNYDEMKRLVGVIKHSDITNFIAAARGTSDNALVFFKYVLEINTNYTVGLSAPSVVTLYRGKINYTNSIVIGCSQSGMAEDVLEVLKKANEQGAVTIGITNNERSPIAKEAKFKLFCMAGEEQSTVATKTFNAELYLLLWLAFELAGNRVELKTLRELKNDVLPIIPQIDALTSFYAEKYKDMQGGFVLSRGISYAMALESEMLLQETCYIPVKGYAGSDFLHGPLALVDETTPIIIFCAKNDGDEELQSIVRADQIKLIEKMLRLKASILLVTNDCVLTGKSHRVDDALISFSVSEEISVFAFSLFAQMFACKLSCLKGNNPDEPRSLEKTVVTK